MKESKLMKEVVKRSVQPDLDSFSSRILNEHEKKIESHPASVRSHYFSAAVACVGLVFIAGLVLGLIIMKSVMKRDFEPNTAPEIIESHSSSADSSVPNTIIPVSPDRQIYIVYNGVKYCAYAEGRIANSGNIQSYPATETFLNFLSGKMFIGFIDNENKGEGAYLYSNYLSSGAVVFMENTADRFYAYENNWIYKFGFDETIHMEDGGLGLTQPQIPDPIPTTSIRFDYKDITFVYDPDRHTTKQYVDQTNFFFSSVHSELISNSDVVFLGTTVNSEDEVKGVVTNEPNEGAAVFYNKKTNTLVTIGRSAVGTYVEVDIYQPTNG